MIRAGVFIGVDKTGGLQQLNDAARGAQRMYEWATCKKQGNIAKTRARLIVDVGGKSVEPGDIYEAIKKAIGESGIDQLILYFAGHGVNINRSEHWLLSAAPNNASAAVNVSGSVELARYCGIKHVVIISDACRVAPEGIQAQNVRGVDVFPNDGGGDRAKPVDQFFACFLGATAAEIKDPEAAAGNYEALYTGALLDALQGKFPEALESADIPRDSALYVKPRKLQSYLEREVPQRVKDKHLEKKVNQNPDAIITSDASWLARLDRTMIPGWIDLPKPMGLPGNSTTPERSPDSPRNLVQELVRSAVRGNQALLGQQLERMKSSNVAGAEQLTETVGQVAAPFGPQYFETECGIKVRGARMIEFFAPRADAEFLGTEGNLLRINSLEGPAASVLLRFQGGAGTVIPALSGFLASITFERGELVDVAYEPSANSWRWGLYRSRAAEIRSLRAVAAASSQHGRFRLNQADAVTVAEKMQYAKVIDPTLAIYAAYAYYDVQSIERIREMSRYLRDDTGATVFDLALLSRTLTDKSVGPNDLIVPFTPLLSQGWALLKAHRVHLHSDLEGIESTVKESLWSLFSAPGLEKLKRVMQTGDVR